MGLPCNTIASGKDRVVNPQTASQLDEKAPFSTCLRELPAKLSDLQIAPGLSDEKAWLIDAKTRAYLLDTADRSHTKPWPKLSQDDYGLFMKTGDRVTYETPYFERRRMLLTLAMAEAVENTGRYLDKIEQGVALICEEAGWQLPAHNGYIRDGEIAAQPDPARPVIDLFAAETGALLATLARLLEEGLEPASIELIDQEVKTRLLDPYLHSKFWWMGLDGGMMINWTPWCTQNVLIAAFARPQPVANRHDILKRAAHSLDAFWAEHGEDGACPEGAYYYGHATLSLFTCLQVINQVSQGAVQPVLDSSKFRNIAEYILYTHVEDNTYANFGDCAPRMAEPDARVFALAAAINSPQLKEYSASDHFNLGSDQVQINLYNHLQALFLDRKCDKVGGTRKLEPIRKFDRAARIENNYDITSTNIINTREGYLPSTGLFVARDKHFYVAVSAGNNGVDHNHNDLGSVIVYLDGQPLLIDIGVETYTAKTFSADRYDIWTMQSSYHNVAEFGGVMQAVGADYKVTEQRVHFDQNKARIDMQLVGAYPSQAQLQSYTRSLCLERGRRLLIEDRFQSKKTVVANFIFAEIPVLEGSILHIGQLAKIQLSGHAQIEIEAIAVNDARLRQCWPETLYRVRISPVVDALQLSIEGMAA